MTSDSLIALRSSQLDTRGTARLDTALSGNNSFVGKTHVKAADSSLFEEARPSLSLKLNLADRCESRSCFLDKCRSKFLNSLGYGLKSRLGNLLGNGLSNWLGDRSCDDGEAHGSPTHHLWIFTKG